MIEDGVFDDLIEEELDKEVEKMNDATQKDEIATGICPSQ